MDITCKEIFAVGAAVLAGFCGFLIWITVSRQSRRKRYRDNMRETAIGVYNGTFVEKTVHACGKSRAESAVIALLEYESKRLELGKGFRLVPVSFTEKPDLTNNLRLSGLGGSVTSEGFYEAKAQLAIGGALAGMLVGLPISAPLSVGLSVTGLIAGWRAPFAVVESHKERRAQQMEKHLPEMLDVMALGLRSGLSFDASLELYSSHFKTLLSKEFSNAQQRWTSGLEHRDEALRKIASTYDSPIFGRVVETIIRSVRFGSSMVDSLESQSAEARADYKARREEQVAKAPVKMMIPTGTLILPAMLILVLGPVLLELIGGSF